MSHADLRVPLSALPGFDPIGLPIYTGGWSGRVLTADDGYLTTWGLVTGGLGGVSVDGAFLDLADAATRDRVARYIADRVLPSEHGCAAPSWYYWDEDLGPNEEPGWVIQPVFPSHHWPASLPWLVDLDPADTTLLPDGSRLVDCIALARVAVFVGGTICNVPPGWRCTRPRGHEGPCAAVEVK